MFWPYQLRLVILQMFLICCDSREGCVKRRVEAVHSSSDGQAASCNWEMLREIYVHNCHKVLNRCTVNAV